MASFTVACYDWSKIRGSQKNGINARIMLRDVRFSQRWRCN